MPVTNLYQWRSARGHICAYLRVTFAPTSPAFFRIIQHFSVWLGGEKKNCRGDWGAAVLAPYFGGSMPFGLFDIGRIFVWSAFVCLRTIFGFWVWCSCFPSSLLHLRTEISIGAEFAAIWNGHLPFACYKLYFETKASHLRAVCYILERISDLKSQIWETKIEILDWISTVPGWYSAICSWCLIISMVYKLLMCFGDIFGRVYRFFRLSYWLFWCSSISRRSQAENAGAQFMQISDYK